MTKLNEVRLHAKPVDATFAWSKNRHIINMLALLLDDYLKEETCMKYINAKNLLPDALVKELQKLYSGAIFMFPPISAAKPIRGSFGLPAEELQQRNRQIVEEFQNGTSMEALAEKYFLSVSAIRKIIYQK